DDAAHALGAVYHGRPIGSWGDATAVSFQASKNLTTGDGGVVLTRHGEWARRIARLGLDGMSSDAWTAFGRPGDGPPLAFDAGVKFRMADGMAGLALPQLPWLVDWQGRREQIWAWYDASLGDLPLRLPPPAAPDTVHARHLYSIELDVDAIGRSRDEIR